MTKTRVLLGAAVFLVFALVATFLWVDLSSRDCRPRGCRDQVAYSIPRGAYVAWGAGPSIPVVVETCIDDRCQTVAVTVDEYGGHENGGEALFESGTLDLGGVHQVTLRVTDQSGMVRYARTDSGVTLANQKGSDCAGTCAFWLLALEPEDLGF